MNSHNKPPLASLSMNRLIAFLVAGGFLFLFIETRIEHHDVLSEKLIAYAPIVFSALGFIIASLAAFKWQEKWIRVLHIYLFLALAVGLGGMYFHNEDRLKGKADTSSEIKDDDMQEDEKNVEETTPPILAPVAFTGLGVVGLLGTYRRWKADVV